MSIRSILAVFVGYSTQFLFPGTILTAHDPGYTKIGRSSKLDDLEDFIGVGGGRGDAQGAGAGPIRG